MSDDLYNPRLESLLKGRFDRPVLRETLTGLLLSDIATMSREEFLEDLRTEDRHIAKALWRTVLTPLRDAYIGYERTAPMRETVDAARKTLRDLIVSHQKPSIIELVNTANMLQTPAGTQLNPRNPGSV
jgi:hypothetical protein